VPPRGLRVVDAGACSPTLQRPSVIQIW